MVDFLLNITYNKTTKNASYQVQQKVGVCMNTIITIGRQFGSAGREIGEKVAEYFGIKCYDKELLTEALFLRLLIMMWRILQARFLQKI